MNASALYHGLIFGVSLLMLSGCLDSESPVDAQDTESHGGNPSVGVKCVIIRSDGVSYTSFWDELNDHWQRYGTTRISVDHRNLNHTNITESDLVASGADVLLIDDARNPLASQILSPSEVTAIVSYTRKGHGLIITGGTFRPIDHTPLTSLVGFTSAVSGGVYLGEYYRDSIAVCERHPVLLRNISDFVTSSNNFYSGSDWNYDGRSSRPEDWQSVISAPGARIIAFVWNLNHLVNEKQCSPISYMETSEYRSVFAGFRPSNWNAGTDDYQFYYNAIVWCKK